MNALEMKKRLSTRRHFDFNDGRFVGSLDSDAQRRKRLNRLLLAKGLPVLSFTRAFKNHASYTSKNIIRQTIRVVDNQRLQDQRPANQVQRC